MKLRQQAKRIAAMRAKRPKRVPLMECELIGIFNDAIQSMLDAASLIDAQLVPSKGRMLWDGTKMHGGPA